MRGTWRGGLAALTSAVLVVAGSVVATASAELACGAVVTTDVHLTRDLHCTTSPGLTLGPGASLDLGGHSLVGPGTGQAVRSDAQAPTTVRNGTVEGWDTGMWRVPDDAAFAQTLTVDGVTFRGNRVGVSVESGSPVDVRGSTFVDNGTALDEFYAVIAVQDSAFVRNGTAVRATQGRVTVTRSTFSDDTLTFGCGRCELDVTHSRVTGSERVLRTYDAYRVQIADNEFRDNSLVLASEYGALADQVLRNRFIRNERAIEVVAPMHLQGNVFVGNDVAVWSDDHDRGYQLEPSLVMEDNVFVRNGDAVHVTFPATVRRTVALFNTGRGIHVPAATDLGGNVAYGNGVEPQCTGVVCRRVNVALPPWLR